MSAVIAQMLSAEAIPAPHTYPIKNGWAAAGEGWAVHGASKEEAMFKYIAAVRLHREMAKRTRPPKEPQP